MTDKVLKSRRIAEDTDETSSDGLDELRRSAMMAHLLDSLESGTRHRPLRPPGVRDGRPPLPYRG